MARSSSFPRTALVTGGASGIGAAIAAALEQDGVDVRVLDIRDGFDVGDPAQWEEVGPVDLACLNAGIPTGAFEVGELDDELYRRALATNVDGVVYGVRRMARVMGDGGAIVATASLAGLIAMPQDPVYTLTKHAVVGFVRAVAPQLAGRGIRANVVCPGFVDTPIVSAELRAVLRQRGVPLIPPETVAEAVLHAARSNETGQAWVVQPGREPIQYRFPGVPGPR